MIRRRVLLALVPVNVAAAVLGDGWTRAGALITAAGCVFAYLAARQSGRKDATR